MNSIIGYADDAPAEPARFEFGLVADALSRVLALPSASAVVLGIHGAWGSGKTTLMRAVRDRIQVVDGTSEPIIIEFNAWKLQERQALWRALILRVVGELRKYAVNDEDIKALEILEESLYRTFAVRQEGPWTINWRTLIVEALSIGLTVANLEVASRVLRRFTFLFGRRKKDDDTGAISKQDVEKLGSVLERKTIERQVNQVESIEQFLAKFTDLVARISGDSRRVFVFVDDLDRCLPEAALEIFESIKLFMDSPNCGFVVAVDREVIRRGLLVRYSAIQAGTSLRGFINADEYHEKTISISYDVPRLGAHDIDDLIDDVPLKFELNDEHRAIIRSGLGVNPRRVKRFMNLLSIQGELADIAVNSGLEVPEPCVDMMMPLWRCC